ncbi:effector-associated constant component EACC1 [Streptomyces xanthophaeus]
MAEDELRSLAAWLEDDRSVRRHVGSELTSGLPPVPGQQGEGIDILSLVLSSGFSTASLAASIAAWRATRPQAPALAVERADGVRIEIGGAVTSETEALVRRLLEGEQTDSSS